VKHDEKRQLSAEKFCIKEGESLAAKAGFASNDESDIVLLAVYFNHSFIGVSFI
jgi:hypothetical protein